MNFFRRRKRFESEMDSELRFHIDAYVEDLVRRGVSQSEAERCARVEFGAIEATKDECRQAWGWQRLDELRADLRLTLRNVRQNPGFAAIAILSLALGIGANTAIFGLVDAVMLRMLPVRDPGRLVFIQNVGTQGANGGPPYPCFELFRDKAASFESMAAFSHTNLELVIDGYREQVQGVYLSGNFYEMLGVKPLMGRALSSSDDQVIGKGGADGPVAVISRAYWSRRFGGDARVLGRAIRMFDQTVTIVGIMPSDVMSLEPGRPIDIAVPMMLSDAASLRDKGAWWLDVVARPKPGVTAEHARAETNALFQSFMSARTMSADIRKLAFDHIELTAAGKGMDGLRTRFSKPLTALMVLAGLVLLTACANVANLFLARATARQREFAVRLAIGAGRARLVRQTLTEGFVFVGAGAAIGIALAYEGEAALASFFADGNRQIVLDLSLNYRILFFTLGVSVVTGLLFGLLPALRAARVNPALGFGNTSRSATGNRASLRLGRVLVIAQVALSTVLLAGAGLFIHSLKQLESVDAGFARNGILTMEVTPEQALIGKPQWMALQAEILEQVRQVPGVRLASWASMSPLDGHDRGLAIEVPGFAPRVETDKHVHLISMSPEYFESFGATMRLGRTFTERDDGTAPRVAVLNENAARFYFGNLNPVGKKVAFPNWGGVDRVFEIAGVIKDMKHRDLREAPLRFVYVPIAQSYDRINRLSLAVVSTGDPIALAAPVRKSIRKIRGSLLITNITTMEKQIERSLIRERLVSTLSTAFGVLALLLACIGLYGVLAYAVTRRTNEIGIRMALGATSNHVVLSVLREALMLAICGVGLGVPAALALASLMKTLLYGVNSFDPPAIVFAVLLLMACAGIAGFVPARRAGRLDPMSALRCD